MLFRVTESRHAGDLSGEGARLYGGRWAGPGRPLLYTASTQALAILETLVNLQRTELPRDRVLVTLNLPDSVRQEKLEASQLPSGWQRQQRNPQVIQAGEDWLQREAVVALEVPSAVLYPGGEPNMLLNPRHPDFAQVTIQSINPLQFDPRLFNSPRIKGSGLTNEVSVR